MVELRLPAVSCGAAAPSLVLKVSVCDAVLDHSPSGVLIHDPSSLGVSIVPHVGLCPQVLLGFTKPLFPPAF